MAVPAGVVHEVEPASRAFRVTVYYLASAVLVDWANTMLSGVEVDKLIKLGVVLVGVYLTWYSKVVAPHSQGREVNCTIFAMSVITAVCANYE